MNASSLASPSKAFIPFAILNHRDDEIQYNLRKLKTDLFNSKSSHATYLLSNLEGVKTSDLSWDDPLASRVVDANSKYVKEMPDHALKSFMEPEDNMRVSAPGFIREKCDEFVLKFADDSEEILPVKLTHNESWKESDEVLNRVTTGILDLLNEVWKNPAFGSELASTQNEGTYVTDIIVPSIRATLRGFQSERPALLAHKL